MGSWHFLFLGWTHEGSECKSQMERKRRTGRLFTNVTFVSFMNNMKRPSNRNVYFARCYLGLDVNRGRKWAGKYWFLYGCQQVPLAGRDFWQTLANFAGLVLGCLDANFANPSSSAS